MLRTTIAALALLTCVALPAPQAAAGMSLLAGIGPRIDADSGDMTTVSVLHFGYEMLPTLWLATEVYGYVLGDAPDGIAFADGQVGALFVPPIPGWFGVEVGVYIGVSNLLDSRHGDSRLIGMLRPELALTATASIFQARLAYQHNVMPLGRTKDLDMDPQGEGQITVLAGIKF